MPSERVTVTLPAKLVQDLDRLEQNRSKFILEAVRQELKRRRREELHRSLRNPHPEASQIAEVGMDEWASKLLRDDAADLVDPKAWKAVRWTPEDGWTGDDR